MDPIQNEINLDSYCPDCNIKMPIYSKGKKKNKYDKEKTIYKCSVCGFTHRKRTLNEILRDLGLRDE